MARAHAHILTAIWSDPDWTALNQSAQHTYLLLLSQQKLNMVGLLDYLPSRWARLAADTSLASVEAAIDELEASRFVVVDRNTDELVIRSLVRHDTCARPDKVANPRVLKALWSAWDAIESRQLRDAVAAEVPASVWDSPKVQPPAQAHRFRQNVPAETPDRTEEPAEEPQVSPEVSGRTSRQNVPHDPVPSTHDPVPNAVADLKQPGNSRDPAGPAAALDNPNLDVFDQALDLLTARELDRNPTRNGNPARHATGVKRGKHSDHLLAARRLLKQDPAITPDDLADQLEPPATPVTGRSSPLDGQQAAALARAEEHMRQLRAAQVDLETDGKGIAAAKAALRGSQP